jgi:hypothetical protein
VSLLFDHLWQSLLFAALAGGLAWLTRKNLAAVRLWIWRIAALKFLLPLGLLFALGAWIGYPVRHSAIPPPAPLADAVSAATPVFVPAHSLDASPFVLAFATVLTAIAAVACLRAIFRKERRAREELDAEDARLDRDWSDRPPSPGFLHAAALTTAAVGTLILPILAGALEDRQMRQAILAADTRTLRSAAIAMSEADHAPGTEPQVIARRDGVLIRNINLKDLVALVYGIDQFEVFGGALPCLSAPYYDVRVSGPVSSPAVFDPYALHKPVTEFLAARFGVSIRVNGSCQDPCVNQQSFVIERL